MTVYHAHHGAHFLKEIWWQDDGRIEKWWAWTDDVNEHHRILLITTPWCLHIFLVLVSLGAPLFQRLTWPIYRPRTLMRHIHQRSKWKVWWCWDLKVVFVVESRSKENRKEPFWATHALGPASTIKMLDFKRLMMNCFVNLTLMVAELSQQTMNFMTRNGRSSVSCSHTWAEMVRSQKPHLDVWDLMRLSA